MRIPKDLKPGDIGVCRNGMRAKYVGPSKHETWPHTFNVGTHNVTVTDTGRQLNARIECPLDIIRIKRIASEPAKVKRDRPSAIDRLIEIATRCHPQVNPTAYAGEMVKAGKKMADCYLNTLLRRAINAARRERRIAKRLEGKS